MADSIEMKGIHTEQGGTKPAPEGQANLLDLPGVVAAGGGEPDMEKGQPAATTTAGAHVDEQRNQHDVSPLTVPTGAAESTDAAGTSTTKQEEGLVPKLRSLATNKACIVSTLVIVALLAATIALAVIVSKDTNKIHSLEHNSKRFDGYLDGFSDVFDHDHHNLHFLAKHNINIDSITSDTCDDDNDDSTTSTVVHPVTADATTTFAFATFIVNKTMTVTAPANTTTLLGVPANTTMMVSFATIQAPSATTESCLEWGDGAGPCTRPYGSPNSTPESVLSVMSSVAAFSATPTTVSADGTTALIFSMSLPATVATPSSGSIGVSDTETVDALSVAASTSSPDCAAPATTTVFVTITTNPVEETNTTGGSTTMTMVDTETNHVTSTIQGSSSLVTMTETLPWGNTTTSTVTVVTALSVPNFTITLQSTVGSNGTAAITTTARTGTATSATTGTSGASTTTAVVASGGKKTVDKPFLGGNTNNNGGHTGNGLYYVVMLVGIVTALLI